MFRTTLLTVALLALLAPSAAFAATPYGNGMMKSWGRMDSCAASAFKQFPDYTPEANAKRDEAMKQCLANGGLPPRGELDHH